MLGTMMWKNWLLKRATPVSTISEIIIPILFMFILVWIKDISTLYDSPNVAYYCGQASPWFYSDNVNLSPTNLDITPFQCLTKPPQCSEDNYYQNGASVPAIPNATEFQGIQLYQQYGYIESGLSSATTNNPFYTYTIADESKIYSSQLDNPSLPISDILQRMSLNNALLALAPESNSAGLSSMVNDLKNFIIDLANNQTAGKNISNTGTDCIYIFSDQDSLDDYITNDDYNKVGYGSGKVGLAIVLNSFDVELAQWDYSIRANYTNIPGDSPSCLYGECDATYQIPSTKFYTNDYGKPQSAEYLYGYTYTGYSTLQQVVDQFIFSHYTTDGSAPIVHASVSLMPTESFETDDFESIISSTLPLFYMLSFLYPVSRMIRALVIEKESRIKEGMKMMGLTDFSYNLSWFLTLLFQFTLMVILIVLVTSTTVFEYSNKILVFIFLEMYSLSIMSMCFLFAAIFSKARTAALLGTLIFFVTYFPSTVVNNPQYSVSEKALTCLLAPSCFSLGTGVFALYEGGLVGVQTDNITSNSSLNFSYSLCVGMLFVDFILYGFLAWYLDKVLPSEYGSPLPFYFIFLPSYWKSYFCSCFFATNKYKVVPASEVDVKSPLLDHMDQVEEANHLENDPNIKVEAITPELRKQLQDNRAVRIRGLRKAFVSQSGGNEIVAVKGLNLDLFEGQVSVLLGHNGAGKSTTISMLVGLTPPSEGTAYVCGLSITDDLVTVRKNLGVCPQHDILFADLTVMQHLELYASFKGVKSKEIKEQATKMIGEVGLLEKANAKSSTLSGGQKRKLSVAIALIGDSKVVILDEPTSGMDPYSRRSTWNIIQKSKKNRVILLTTHFMDEADILGDRIAIMADGKLQCVGAPYFLKSSYGVGYTLTVIKTISDRQKPVENSEESKDATQAHDQQSDHVNAVVATLIPGAEPLSTVGAEQSFRVPFSATAIFPTLFNTFETKKEELGISEFGISVTTLEEVFMRVGKMSGHDHDIPEAEIIEDSKVEGAEMAKDPMLADFKKADGEEPPETAWSVFTQHFQALLIKRVIYGRRDTRMFVCQLLIPAVIVILGLALLLLQPSSEQPDYVLSSQQYNVDLASTQRNYVPTYIAPGAPGAATSSVATEIYEKFNFDQIQAQAVPIGSTSSILSPSDTSGVFYGCSQGATPLYEMSTFLLNTVDNGDENGASRYGAVTLSNSSNTTLLEYNVMVNGSAYHGVGVYVNEVHTAFLEVLSGNALAYITTHNFPLPETFTETQIQTGGNGFVASTFIMIAFCFIPGSFASFVVKEREVHAKHQQIISGVGLTAYWTSTWVWDVFSYLFTAATTIAIVYAYQIESYTDAPASSAFVTVLFVFGPATAAFAYLLSYLFDSHTTAQTLIMFFTFVTGLGGMITSFVLTLIPSTSALSLQLRYVFRIFPAFCLGDSLLELALCLGNSADGGCPTIDSNGYNFLTQQGVFAWDITGANLTFLAIESVLYFAIAIGIEYSLTFPSLLLCFSSLGLSNEDIDPNVDNIAEDDDVHHERDRVMSGEADDEIVLIKKLRKVYVPLGDRIQYIVNSWFGGKTVVKKKVAVNSLCFGVPKGQCFGFLGINGAGKTTTLSILSGEFPPTSGTAFIDGSEISQDQSKIRRKIGYCPQFDALLELLTVREHIELYGRIKGKKGKELQEIVDGKLDQLDLRPFEHKTAGSLSGGNKRKLSVAVATVCEPSIVFLDEPSTGMDPVARRFMWKVISRMSTQDGRCSIILTTHSMEEAEALCTRIGVMVNGRLQCLGSPQHLKLRFGDGFEVNIKTETPNDEVIALKTKDLILESGIPGIEYNNIDQKELSAKDIQHVLTKRLTIVETKAFLGTLGLWADSSNSSDFTTLPIELQVAVEVSAISLRSVVEWIINETAARDIDEFMILMSKSTPDGVVESGAAEGKNLPGSHLLERSSANTFKYRLRMTGKPSLAFLFGKFEIEKAKLRIQDYSIGQTTLEQIFNQFAASQDNPEVSAAAAKVAHGADQSVQKTEA